MDDLDRLARDLDRAPDEMADRADKLVRASTLQTEALGKGFSPVDTGFMRASITSEFERTTDRSTGETGPTAWYSHFPHDGTSRIAPNPFMWRAADVVEPQFYAAAETLGDTVLDG